MTKCLDSPSPCTDCRARIFEIRSLGGVQLSFLAALSVKKIAKGCEEQLSAACSCHAVGERFWLPVRSDHTRCMIKVG